MPVRIRPTIEMRNGLQPQRPTAVPIAWIVDARGQKLIAVRPQVPGLGGVTEVATDVVSRAMRYRNWLASTHERVVAALENDGESTLVRRRVTMEIDSSSYEIRAIDIA